MNVGIIGRSDGPTEIPLNTDIKPAAVRIIVPAANTAVISIII